MGMEERIGKYVIHKVALTTGYAQVVFCLDPDLQVPVAVKLFDPRRLGDSPLSPAQWLARFVSEARGLAAVEHTYVTPVKALEQLPDGRPYFVMPYFAAHLSYEIGKDGGEGAERPRRLTTARTLLLVRQLSSALAALHRRGMVHRWVKPSNILLTAKEGGAIRLADFSMAKFPGQNNPPLPDIWAVPSPYTAPEQLTAASSVGPEADVYAVAALACRLLTGAPPVPGELPPCPDDVPENLWSLIAAGLDLDPARRPANAGALLPALEGVVVTAKPARDHIVMTKKAAVSP